MLNPERPKKNNRTDGVSPNREGGPFIEDICPRNELSEPPRFVKRGSRMILLGTFREKKRGSVFQKENVLAR